MAITTSSTLKFEFSWLQKDTGGGSTNSQDAVAMTQTMLLSDGTGTGNANNVWYGSDTLTSGEEYTIDLYNLSRDILGGQLSGSFENGKIRFIGVENTSTGVEQTLSFTNTGANHLQGYSNGAGCSIPVYPGSMVAFSNHLSGFTVDSSNRYLTILDGGYAATYEIGIVGTV